MSTHNSTQRNAKKKKAPVETQKNKKQPRVLNNIHYSELHTSFTQENPKKNKQGDRNGLAPATQAISIDQVMPTI